MDQAASQGHGLSQMSQPGFAGLQARPAYAATQSRATERGRGFGTLPIPEFIHKSA